MSSKASPGPEPASPCIGLCELDRETALCKGCLRTLREISTWIDLSPSERRDVLDRIRRRESDPALAEVRRRWDREARQS